MKRVLVVGPTAPPVGGMETVMEQMRDFKLPGFSLSFFSTTRPPLLKAPLFGKIYTPFLYLKMRWLVRFGGFDLVHLQSASGNHFWQNASYAAALRRQGVPYIFHMHGGGFKDFWASASKGQRSRILEALDGASYVIALSDSWKGFYEGIGVRSEVIALPNRVPLYPMKGSAGPEVIALFLGRIGKMKGSYDLIEASRGVPVQVFLVGPPDEPKKLSEQVSLRKNVRIIPPVYGKEKEAYLAEADILVLPSYAEGLPISLLEGMSAGLPIIATRVGAIPEVIGEENGILIEPGDRKALREALLLLAADASLRKRMGAKNRALIKERYSLESFQDDIETLYRSIAQRQV